MPSFIQRSCLCDNECSSDLNQKDSGFFRMPLFLCPSVITSSKAGYSPTFFLVMSVLGQTLLTMKAPWICTCKSVLTFLLCLIADVQMSSIYLKQMSNEFLP